MAVSLNDDNYKYALMDQVSQLNGVNFLAFLAAVGSHVKKVTEIYLYLNAYRLGQLYQFSARVTQTPPFSSFRY